MSKLTDLVNDAAQTAGDAGRFVKRNAEAGVKAANDTGKAVVETVDKATKPVQDFASAAGSTLAKGARAAGKFYLRHRDRIDTASIAYPVGQQIASKAIARTVATKLLGVAGGAAALHAAPIVLAATAVLYGPKIVSTVKDLLQTGDTLEKAKNGDKAALKDLIDTIAETVAKEEQEPVEELTEEQKAEIKRLAKAIEDGEAAEATPPAPANDDQDNGAPAP